MDVTAHWRTSSYTGQGGGNCVESATTGKDRRVPIRTPKTAGTGIGFPTPVLAELTTEISQRPYA